MYKNGTYLNRLGDVSEVKGGSKKHWLTRNERKCIFMVLFIKWNLKQISTFYNQLAFLCHMGR